MRIAKVVALAALISTGAVAAYASPFDATPSLNSLSDAYSATVLPVTPGAAKSLKIDVDTASLQALIKQNPYLARTVEQQGYTIDQIVGLDAPNSDNVTLYAL